MPADPKNLSQANFRVPPAANEKFTNLLEETKTGKNKAMAGIMAWFNKLGRDGRLEVINEKMPLSALSAADVMAWIDKADLEDVRDVLEHAGSRVDIAEGFKPGHYIKAARKRPKPGDNDRRKK